MADGNITFSTILDNANFTKSIASLGNVIKSGLQTGLVAMTAVTAGFGVLMKQGIEYNSKMEDYTTNFATLLGNQTKAIEKVSQLKEMASKTPFGMQELADGTQTLLSFGIANSQTEKILTNLGDVALGNKEKFKSLTLSFAQMSATGRLMGGDLNQMINAGFNPLQEISKTTGKSIAKLKDEMSKGKISADMVTKAFESATSAGGQFAGGMESASQTMSGMVSTLQDDFASLIGEVFMPISEQLMSTVVPSLQSAMGEMSNAFSAGGAEQLVVTIGNIFADMTLKISEQTPQMITLGNNLIISFIEGLSNNTEAMALATINIVNSIISGFATVAPYMVNLGIEMVQALLSGFNVSDDFQYAFQSIVDGFYEIIGGIESSGIVEAIALIGDKLIEITPLFVGIITDTTIVAMTGFANIITLVVNNLDTLVPIVGAVIGGMTAYNIIMPIGAFVTATFKDIALVTAGATGFLTKSVIFLNEAFKANPVGFVIAVIASLIAILAILYNKNEAFRNLVNSVFKSISEVVKSAFESVQKIFKNTMQVLEGALMFFKGIFTLNWDLIWKGALTAINGFVRATKSTFVLMVNAVLGQANILINEINRIFNAKIPPIKLMVDDTSLQNATQEQLGELQTAQETSQKNNYQLFKDIAESNNNWEQSNKDHSESLDNTTQSMNNLGSSAGGAGKKLKTKAEIEKEAFNKAKEIIENKRALEQISLQEELQAYQKLRDTYKNNADIAIELDKKIFNLKKDLLKQEKELDFKKITDRKSLGEITLQQEVIEYEKLKEKYKSNAETTLELDKTLYSLRKELRKEQEEEINKIGEATTQALKLQKREEIDLEKQTMQEKIDLLDDVQLQEIQVATEVKDVKVKLIDEATQASLKGISSTLDAFLLSSNEEIQKRIDIIALTDKETADKLRNIEEEKQAIKSAIEEEKQAIQEKQELEKRTKLEKDISVAETPEKSQEAREALEKFEEDIKQKKIEKERNDRLKVLEQDTKDTLENAKKKIELETEVIIKETKKQQDLIKKTKEDFSKGDTNSLKALEEEYKNFEKIAEQNAINLMKSGEEGQKQALALIEQFYPEYKNKGKSFVQKMADGVVENKDALLNAINQVSSVNNVSKTSSVSLSNKDEELLNKNSKQMMQVTTTSINEFLPMLVEPSTNVIVTFINEMVNNFYKLKPFSNSLFSEIRTLVSNQNWQQVGSNMIMGMVAGIVSSQQALIDAAIAAARAAVEGIEGALEISSPSRVLMRDGNYMAQGMAIGFTDGMQKHTGEMIDSIPSLAYGHKGNLPIGIQSSGAFNSNNSNISNSKTENVYHFNQQNTINGNKMTSFEMKDFIIKVSQEMKRIGV